MEHNSHQKRSEEFLKCLGNGKSIYECESDNDMIDYYLEAERWYEER